VVVVVVLLACLTVDLATRWWLEGQLADRLAARLDERLAGAQVRDVRLDGPSALVALATRTLELDLEVLVPFDRLTWGPGTDGPALPEDVTWSASAGQLVASVDVRRGGLTLPVDVALALGVDDGDLVATPTVVVAAGVQVPIERAADRLPARLAALASPRRVDVPLPDGLHLADVDVRPDGVVLSATAHDVPLPP
jgi:hypothetical protein